MEREADREMAVDRRKVPSVVPDAATNAAHATKHMGIERGGQHHRNANSKTKTKHNNNTVRQTAYKTLRLRLKAGQSENAIKQDQIKRNNSQLRP